MPAKVKLVKRAQKDQGTCEKCGVALPAGTPYRWFKVGFRSTVKHRRCMKTECTPTAGDLDSSQMAEVRQAQEEAQTAVDAWNPDAEDEVVDNTEDLAGILEDVATTATETKEQYEETISEHPMLESSLQDKVDALESWISDLESWSGDDYEAPEEGASDTERTEAREAWVEEQRQSARDVIDSLEA